MKQKMTVLFLAVAIVYLLSPALLQASIGDTSGEVVKNAAGFGKDLVGLPAHLVLLLGNSLKLVGEVLLFPFTLLGV